MGIDVSPTGTDVAGEMDALRDGLRDCETCYKACNAAVEMLAVSSIVCLPPYSYS
jgi:hypothetical protein